VCYYSLLVVLIAVPHVKVKASTQLFNNSEMPTAHAVEIDPHKRILRAAVADSEQRCEAATILQRENALLAIREENLHVRENYLRQ
jgi:hypothetical protein